MRHVFLLAIGKKRVEGGIECFFLRTHAKPEADHPLLAGGERVLVDCCGLGADAGRVHRAGRAGNNVIVEGILYERRAVWGIVEAAVVGLVVSENPLRPAFGLEAVIAKFGGMCAESLPIG